MKNKLIIAALLAAGLCVQASAQDAQVPHAASAPAGKPPVYCAKAKPALPAEAISGKYVFVATVTVNEERVTAAEVKLVEGRMPSAKDRRAYTAVILDAVQRMRCEGKGMLIFEQTFTFERN